MKLKTASIVMTDISTLTLNYVHKFAMIQLAYHALQSMNAPNVHLDLSFSQEELILAVNLVMLISHIVSLVFKLQFQNLVEHLDV